MTYCEYIADIIDKLISQQEPCLDYYQSHSLEVNDTQAVSNTCTDTNSQILFGIHVHLS